MSLRKAAFSLLALWVAVFSGASPALSQDAKASLAPTGKLRGAFLANNPIHATKDANGVLK
jgi:hypothetical protein